MKYCILILALVLCTVECRRRGGRDRHRRPLQHHHHNHHELRPDDTSTEVVAVEPVVEPVEELPTPAEPVVEPVEEAPTTVVPVDEPICLAFGGTCSDEVCGSGESGVSDLCLVATDICCIKV